MCMRARQKPIRDDPESATEFKTLFADISRACKEDTLQPQRITDICRKIQKYCQLAVRAERHESDQFDFFCQNKSLQLLYNLFLRSQSKEMLTCIIQVLAMMLVNFSRSDSIHWFLSSTAVMNLLQVRFPQLDTELAEYYINLLKSLSAKVDAQTVHVFYNEKIPTFPLMWQAIRFFNHPEALVRNTSRNVVLSVAGIREEAVGKYIASFPFVIYYSHLASYLRDSWLAMGAVVTSPKLGAAQKADQLNLLVEDHYDLLLYLDDLGRVVGDSARRQLMNCLIRQCFIPLIRDFEHCRLKMPNSLTLFLLSVVFRSFTHSPELLNLIVVVLFGRYLPRELILYMLAAENQQSLASYNRAWSFGHFWDRHHDVVARNCRKQFISNDSRPRSMSDSTDQNDVEQGDSPTKLAQSMMLPSNSSMLSSHVLFGNDAPLSEIDRQAAKIEQLFELRILKGSIRHSRHHDVFEILECMQRDLMESSFIDLDELDDNKNVAAVMGCLSADDEATVASCIELITQLLKTTTPSREILKFGGLHLSEQSSNLHNSDNLRRIVLKVVDMLRTRNGSFTIQTYLSATELLKIIVRNNESALFDGQAVAMINETVRTVADRLAAYACNFKDYSQLLKLYDQAQQSLKAPTNKQDTLLQMLTFPEEHQVTDLSSQIVKDFAVYLLLAEIKATFVMGSPSLVELTSTRSFDVSASSMLGKEIEFPESHVTVGEYKESQASLNFKCFLLINKIGFMLSEKTGSHRGRIVLNCSFSQLACEQRQTQLKRLYFTYSEKQRRDRCFYIQFDSSKVAYSVKRDFDGYRHQQAKDMVANLMKALTKCTQPTQSQLKKPSQPSSFRECSKQPQPQSEKSTEPATTQREPVPPLNQSLMDMF